jgi:predicted nucleic acid-binding protein
MNEENYVLDACALLALFNKEEGGDKVNKLFKQAKSGEITLYMSVVNLIEVFYGIIRDEGLEKATEIQKKIDASPLEIVDTITPQIYHRASLLKGTNKMSIADAIGIATAESLDAAFVTSDHHELDAVEAKEAIDFCWIRDAPSSKK